MNNFKQNRRFYDKYNLLENKLEKISVFKSYASLLGKVTNDGTTCTEAAKAGYLLMNGCETSAAAACNNTEFTANYTTAIGCIQIINCNTTKIPDECKIRTELEEIVDKTKECTNKKTPGTFTYCMSYIKENISTVVSDCLDQILTETTTTETTTETTAMSTTTMTTTATTTMTTTATTTMTTTATTTMTTTTMTTTSVTTTEITTTATTTMTTTEASSTTQQKVTKETSTIFTEGDEIVEQKESYNPDTKEMTLSVPAHGNNVALKAIIGAAQMVTSYDNYCVVGDSPDDVTTKFSGRSSRSDVDEVDSATVVKVYSFNVVEGDMTDAERAQLPESFQNACKDKPIQKTKRVVVDEATFNQDSLDSAEEGRGTLDFDFSFGLTRSSRQDNCSSQKTSCSKFDKGCYFTWANPDGSSVNTFHNIPKTVHCLSCCENQTTSALCQCSEINSGSKWKNCYKKTNGDCGFNGWQCNSTDSCLEYSEQCNGTCYGSLDKCGDKCVVPLEPGASSFEYMCQDQCIDNTVTCNGTCPASNPAKCGKSCLTNVTANYYQDCDGDCISKFKPCNGTCAEGYIKCSDYNCQNEKYYYDCNGTCTSKELPCNGTCVQGYALCNNYCQPQDYFDTNLWNCESTGQCISKSIQCNGTCPDDRTKCGDNMCLCSADDSNCEYSSNNFRDCDGTCIRNYEPCNGTCVQGYHFCNDYCVSDVSFQAKYWNCESTGQCIGQWEQCNGTCFEGYHFCDERCITQVSFDKYWRKCEDTGKCTRKFEQCGNGACPDGRIKCGDNMCLCNGTDDGTFCAGGYNTNKWYDCNGTCIQNREACGKTCVSGWNFCEEYKNITGTYQFNRTRCIEESRFIENFEYCSTSSSDCKYCVNNRDGCPSLPVTCQPSTLSTSTTTAAPATPMVTGRARRRILNH